MNGDGGLSDRDLFLSGGSAWFQGLGLLLVVVGVFVWCWYALHGGRLPIAVARHLLLIWRRGRDYRRRLRNARHRRTSLTHLTFRSPTR